MGSIKTQELQYDLPPDLIAQRPCEPRDASRLMVIYRATGTIEHRTFRDLPGYLDPRDVLVLNRTRVLPARFSAKRASGGGVRGLFVHELSAGRWHVMVGGLRRLKDGEPIVLLDARSGDPSPWTLTILTRLERGVCEVQVDPPDAAVEALNVVGEMPLPPYIRRASATTNELAALDHERYQTVFAERPGAVAAPTAGLHFTPELLKRIEGMGVATADVILHVGLGTFQPVEVEELADHPMHAEWYEMSRETEGVLSQRRDTGGRIVAVGTTSVRVLESCPSRPEAGDRSGWTDLLIYPPYQFRSTDVLLTNFHLPGSTLLALVSAFMGLDPLKAAYGEAIREKYRFFSYGDAMLIL